MAMSIDVFRLTYLFGMGLLLWIMSYTLPNIIDGIYDALARTLLGSMIMYVAYPAVKVAIFDKMVSPKGKAVLITGCDTGFGHQLARELDSSGFNVFACCLFPTGDGAKKLKQSCSDALHILGLDVRKDDSVRRALAYVKENLNGSILWSVVNNAGILKGFEIEFTKVSDFEECLAVNTLGIVRVTKAFLPLLRKSKGRVITVTSLAVRLCPPMGTAYFMSKWATSCFCDCLRQEMHSWGVKVITIEPEVFGTKMTDSSVLRSNLHECLQDLDEEIKADYGAQYFELYKTHFKKPLLSCDKIYKVISCLVEAVCLQEPNNSYTPSRNKFVGFILIILNFLPQSVTDIIMRTSFRRLKFPYAQKRNL